MGFSRPAADPALGSAELSQYNAQCEDAPRSLGLRLKNKGKHCLGLFKSHRSPGQSNAYTGAMHRWMPEPLKEKMASLLNPCSVYDDSRQKALYTTLPPAVQADYQATNVTQDLHEAQDRSSWSYPNIDLQSPAGSNLSANDKSTFKRTQGPRQWSDRVRGYKTSIRSVARWDRSVTSAPVAMASPEMGDLTGVGSQYEADNNSTSALIQDTGDMTRPGSESGASFEMQEHERNLTRHGDTNATSYSENRASASSNCLEAAEFFSTTHPSDINLPYRRLSNGTTPTSVSVAESIFTTTGRPSSIISSATSTWDSIGRASFQQTRSASFFRKGMSSSSSLTASGDSLRPSREPDMEDYPLPIVPVQRVNTASPARSVTSWVASLDHSISDQVALAGWVAQQRRANKSRMHEMFQQDLPEEEEEIKQASPHLDPDSAAEHNLETASKSGLSTIDEQSSDAGCSAISMRRQSLSDQVDHGYLCIPRHSSNRYTGSCSGTETTTGPVSVFSEGLGDRGLSPATSVAGNEASEEVDPSETDESMSDVTNETDDSLYEAFTATSLDPGLFNVAITLKDHITSLVLAKVLEWVRSCSPGQQSGNGSPNVQGSSGSSSGLANKTSSAARNGGKKRGLDNDDGPDDLGRGSGGDQDKRRKTEPLSAEAVHNLACPFVKGYPDDEWPRCQKGWSTVHRIKEHIYRYHKVPIHCDRCFSLFKTEKQLKEHRREAVSCLVVNPPRRMPGIDTEMKERLKCRQGIQNATEETKWQKMYRILFPEEEDIPSPYCDLKTLEIPMSAETRAQYRNFLRREIPHRVIRETFDNLRNMPEFEFNLQLSERRFSVAITQAVWNAFDTVIPSLLPQTGPPEPLVDGMPERVPRAQDKGFSADSTQRARNLATQKEVGQVFFTTNEATQKQEQSEHGDGSFNSWSGGANMPPQSLYLSDDYRPYPQEGTTVPNAGFFPSTEGDAASLPQVDDFTDFLDYDFTLQHPLA
ncbi:hypothetical protein FZEAL_2568 [Fusarium zealandicum]|uniref:C2H2-type domain-containing protein n=1 Tax=Fusarium zealandicum TaxID=1053134 RepID=A0A8H4UR62_9HYPO|nr:hypothetical protein FZEAL_2568 [Fusarium zealandicum]